MPFLAVNHLEGHALTARLTDDVPFPFLLLLVSGGHCQLLAVEGVGAYTRLGTTVDDALGEAFDKVAKMLDLGYPGGPLVERAARDGDPARFALPRPMKGRPGCHFSFSGLKTAVKHVIAALARRWPASVRRGRCVRVVPGGGGGRAGGPHPQRDRRVQGPVSRRRTTWSSPAAWPPTARSAPVSPNWPNARACG